MCRDLEVGLGDCAVNIYAYLFGLGGVDLISRVAWLQTLGEVRLYWGKKGMKL